MGYSIVLFYIPWLIDVVLLLRVLVVYPPHTVSRAKLAVLVGPPILLKVVRVVVWAVYTYEYLHKFGVGTHIIGAGDRTWIALWDIDVAAWVLASVDNAYVSVIFLWKLRNGFKTDFKGALRAISHVITCQILSFRHFSWAHEKSVLDRLYQLCVSW
jgi:hypothetical protein